MKLYYLAFRSFRRDEGFEDLAIPSDRSRTVTALHPDILEKYKLSHACFGDLMFATEKDARLSIPKESKNRLTVRSVDLPVDGPPVPVRKLRPRKCCSNCRYLTGSGPHDCELWSRTHADEDRVARNFVCELWSDKY